MQSNNILSLKPDNVLLSNKKYTALNYFCDILKLNGADPSCYTGYYISSEIQNGMNRFDLLRFSEDRIINIHLATQFDFLPQQKLQHIKKQLTKNYFYLTFLPKRISCYCLCEDDGIYKLNYNNSVVRVEVNDLLGELLSQNSSLQNDVDISMVLSHSKFLVSPYQDTQAFVNNEYFLTDNQQKIRDEILQKINDEEFFAYCVESSYGAGKTMLAYDLAKQLMAKSQNSLIIHSGLLKDGILRLKLQHGYNICTIKEMSITLQCLKLSASKYYAIIVDNAHLFSNGQIELITQFCYDQQISVVFLYDENKIAAKSKEIYCYLKNEDNGFNVYKSQLKDRFRYNKEVKCEIEKFLKNIYVKDDNAYNIDLSDYIMVDTKIKESIKELENIGYKIINLCYKNIEENDKIIRNVSCITENEFEKIAIVIDSGKAKNNFENTGIQMLSGNNYDFLKLLFSSVKNAVSSLKIIAY